MVDDSLITEDLRSKIGIELESVICKVEQGMIQRFVLAIDDPNSLWQDEELAGKGRYGGIVAPPTFILTVGFEQMQQQRAALALMPYEGGLHGGTELECYQSVRPGDVITGIPKVVDIRERQSQRMGKMLFMTVELTYKNQRQELVAKCRQMFIRYKVEGTEHG